MSWLRIDDKMPRHKKVRPLSDAAFRLHITALAHCCEEENDGVFKASDLDVMVSIPRGRKLDAALRELEAGGVWTRQGDEWRIHDFLYWNPSSEERKAKREASKQRMAIVRANKLRTERERIANETQTHSERSPNVHAGAGAGAGTGLRSLTSFPRGTRISDDQRATLEGSMIPGWAIDQLEAIHASRALNLDKTMTVQSWQNWLVRCISNDWNDPKKRPKRVDTDAETWVVDDAGGLQ